jgi:glutathione synthase/RimK-type ligase-like ATP-grasp enzyme
VKFAQTESGEFIRATMQLLDEKPRFWINPIAAKLRSDRKPVQLANAMEVGLRIPRTLLSNDPERIRNFYRENDKRIVYKPLTAASWVSDDKAFATYTTRVTDELLRNDASLSNAPGIYQECIEKEFELRITVIGRSIFAAKLESQKDGFYLTDWRANQLDHKMPCAVFQLPLEIEEKCFALMDRLGIVFGCIDMVATPEGGYVFLEVNEMGQFLWIEDANPDFPLLDCFVNFLAARNPKYRYQAGNPQCSFGNFLDWMKSQPDFEPDGTRHIPLPRSYEMQE